MLAGMERRSRRRSRGAALAVFLLLAMVLLTASGATASRIRQRIFRPSASSHLSNDRITTSDPANSPISAADFLSGRDLDNSMVERWQSVLEEAPRTARLEQEVLLQTQSQQARHHARQAAAVEDLAMLAAERLMDGKAASTFEPKQWPAESLTPNPYKHLAPHNNIQGGLGVQPTAIPWEYRQYAGQLNSHRKAEPLIYSPLVLAKDAQGTNAIDLTSILNKRYQLERASEQPEYASTLSSMAGYRRADVAPTAHWLPQLPHTPDGQKKKWEEHFLDLYAPTPPPLLAPVPPKMPKTVEEEAEAEAQKEYQALAELAAHPLPSVLTQREHARPMVLNIIDSVTNQPIAYHDNQAEEERLRRSREVDLFAPASVDEDAASIFLEQDTDVDVDVDADADADADVDADLDADEE